MSQIVVDTDVASYLFNWHSAAQKYANALRGSDLILSFMSVAELRMGAISAGWGPHRRLLLEQFMRGFELAGRPMSPQDAWIAAPALAIDAPLATNNRRDYEHVHKLRLLTL